MSPPAAVDLYWIPLGAGGWFVRRNGRLFERLQAARDRRDPCDLYHAALIVEADGDRHAIELAPAAGGDAARRGVVATGPVGSRALRQVRLFRYEVRCRRGGTIPDLGFAVGGPCRLSADPVVARRVPALVARVPAPVWGRDELRTGDMWNSNSVIAWVLAMAALPAGALHPPAGGRAPGWTAGVCAAARAGSAPAIASVRASRSPGAASSSVRSGRSSAPRTKRTGTRQYTSGTNVWSSIGGRT